MFRQGEQKSYVAVHSAIVGGGWRELKEHFPAVFAQNTFYRRYKEGMQIFTGCNRNWAKC